MSESEPIANLCVVCHKQLHKSVLQMTVFCKTCGLLYVNDNPGIPPEDPRYESYVGKREKL